MFVMLLSFVQQIEFLSSPQLPFGVPKTKYLVILCEIPQKIVQQGIFALVPLFFFLLSSLLIGTKDSLVGGEVKRSSKILYQPLNNFIYRVDGTNPFQRFSLREFLFTDLVINFITKLVLISFLIRRLGYVFLLYATKSDTNYICRIPYRNVYKLATLFSQRPTYSFKKH